MRTAQLGLLPALLILVSLSAGLAGCTAIADLGRFKKAKDAGGAGSTADAAQPGDAAVDAATDSGADAGPAIGCDDPATLCLRLLNFDKYAGHLITVDLASQNEELRSRALLDPGSSAAMQDIVMPLAVPTTEVPDAVHEHPLHVEIWVDKNDDRMYEPLLDDGFLVSLSQKSHAIADAKNLVTTALTPQPTSIGGDFSITLTGFGIHVHRMLELMVIGKATGRTIGMYRLQEIPDVPGKGPFTLTLPGVIKGGLEYDVEFYADADGNGVYSHLFDDHSWILTDRKGTSSGLHIDRLHTEPDSDPDSPFRELHYQYPFKN